MTTKTKILHYLNGRTWTSGSELESQYREWFTKPSVISRRCRELVNEGKLERIIKNKAVQYRIYQPRMSTEAANNYLKSLELEENRINQVSLGV